MMAAGGVWEKNRMMKSGNKHRGERGGEKERGGR